MARNNGIQSFTRVICFLFLQNSRVENSHLGFLCESLVFLSKRAKYIAIRSFPRANRSRMLLMESDSLLGIKMGKAVKNCQKHGENNELFRAKRSIFESERAKVRFVLKKRVNHSRLSLLKTDSLSSLVFKERRERITHGRSLRRAILCERVKSEIANSQPCSENSDN